MATSSPASIVCSGWLKKESETKPGSLAKRWVVLEAGHQLFFYKDTACDDLRCMIRLDYPGVLVSIVNGSYIQIDACVQNGQPLSSVTLKAETAAIAFEWATRLSPIALSDDHAKPQPDGSIEESHPNVRSRRKSRHLRTNDTVDTSECGHAVYSEVSVHSPLREEDTHRRQRSVVRPALPHPGPKREKLQTTTADRAREVQVQITEASPTSFPSPTIIPGSLAAPSPAEVVVHKAGRSRKSRKPHRTEPSEGHLGGVSSGRKHRGGKEGRCAGEQVTAAGSPVLVADITVRGEAHKPPPPPSPGSPAAVVMAARAAVASFVAESVSVTEAATRLAAAAVADTTSTVARASIVGRFGGGGGEICAACAKVVYPSERVTAKDKCFHRVCFRCEERSAERTLALALPRPWPCPQPLLQPRARSSKLEALVVILILTPNRTCKERADTQPPSPQL